MCKIFSFKYTVYHFMFLVSSILISAVLLWGHLNAVFIFSCHAIYRNYWKCVIGILPFWHSITSFSLPMAVKDLALCLSISNKCIKKSSWGSIPPSPALVWVWAMFTTFCSSWFPGLHVQEILTVSSNKSFFEFIWFFLGSSSSAVKHQSVNLIKNWLQLGYRKVLKHCKPCCVIGYILVVLHVRLKVLYLSDDWDEV